MPAELTGMEMLKVAAEAPSSGASARPAGAVGGYAMVSRIASRKKNPKYAKSIFPIKLDFLILQLIYPIWYTGLDL